MNVDLILFGAGTLVAFILGMLYGKKDKTRDVIEASSVAFGMGIKAEAHMNSQGQSMIPQGYPMNRQEQPGPEVEEPFKMGFHINRSK